MRARLIPLLALGAVLVTSCRVDAVWDITMDAAGGGVVVQELAFDDEFTRMAGQLGTGGDPRRAAVRDSELAAVAGAEVAETRRDDMDVFTITVPFADPQSLGSLLALPESPFRSSQVYVTDDEAFFRAEADIPEALRVTSILSSIPGANEDIIIDLIAETVAYRVRLTLPGDIGDHNADHEAGDSLEWTIRLDPDFLPVVVTAISDPTPPAGFPWWVIGAIGIVLLLGLVGVLMAGSQERRAAVAAGDAPGSPDRAGETS